jgi:hypothetical protein
MGGVELAVGQVWCERRAEGAARRVLIESLDEPHFVHIRTLITTEGRPPKRPVRTRVRQSLWHRTFALDGVR